MDMIFVTVGERLDRKMMKLFTCRVVLVLLSLMAGSVYAGSASIQDYTWLGLPIGSTHLPPQEEPLSLVVDAHRLAKAGDRDAFLSLFDEVIHSDTQAEVESLFKQWNESTRYVYTLAAECQVMGKVPALRGIMITAKAMDGIVLSEDVGVSPFVLYAWKSGEGWKLTTRDLAPSVTESLLQEVKGFHTSLHPSSAEIEQMAGEFDRKYITHLEDKKFPQPMILAAKEVQEQANQGVVVNSWKEWQRVYQAEMMTNSSAFSCLEPVPLDFSTPYAAWRSTLYATATGDVKTLYKYADSGKRAVRKKLEMYQQKDTGKNMLTWKNLTRIVPLMQATAVVDGNEYVLFKYRAEDPVKGRDGFVTFSSKVFRKQSNVYYATTDMDDSSFIRSQYLARPDGSSGTINSFGMYPKWHENWSKSKFPVWFYTIQEESKTQDMAP